MLRRVKLERLPDGLAFPETLADRISHDAVSRELRFHGFMSKVDFDKLVRLHNDIAYQRALERLFQICTFESAPEPAGWRSLTMLLAAGTAVAIVALIVVALLLVH
ncbi:MAG: hypothetical protein O3C40_13410 [Planctomycetota bacterium]|nr:hypothetical protein [Planctomycetota bacterium]